MSSQIRAATAEDTRAIVAMAQRFIEETGYQQHITGDGATLAAFVGQLLGNPDAAIFVSDSPEGLTGMIALLKFVHPYSGRLVVSELVWWVNPEHRGSAGLRLLRQAEQWTTAQGVDTLQMIAPNDRVGAFYEACGYARVEISYQRRMH